MAPFTSFRVTACGKGLLEEVPQSQLRPPPRIEVRIVDEGLGWPGELEHRRAVGVELRHPVRVRQQPKRRGCGGASHLAYPPVRADQVAHVEDVEADLEIVP